MSDTWRILASGPGWRVIDAICCAGPDDPTYEEQHDFVCIAAVTEGMFRYRTRQGQAALAPGGVLLGEAGACYECGHDHGRGDRCLAFHFTPAQFESVLAATPNAKTLRFARAHLPPLERFAPLMASAEAARDEGDAAALEEIGLRLAGAVTAALHDAPPARTASRRDQERVAYAVRRIESDADAHLPLGTLANEAGMSRYHFLRTFRDVVGMTPHQFVLRTRLHRAAVRLRRSADAISAIALDAGFNDLSTFNRRFRRIMGASPSAFRAGAA